jgi:hypothetical protein
MKGADLAAWFSGLRPGLRCPETTRRSLTAVSVRAHCSTREAAHRYGNVVPMRSDQVGCIFILLLLAMFIPIAFWTLAKVYLAYLAAVMITAIPEILMRKLEQRAEYRRQLMHAQYGEREWALKVHHAELMGDPPAQIIDAKTHTLPALPPPSRKERALAAMDKYREELEIADMLAKVDPDLAESAKIAAATRLAGRQGKIVDE